jgi:PKD repeat protein
MQKRVPLILPALTALATLVPAAAIGQKPNPALIENPGMSISSAAHGRQAVTALGSKLDAVAARYGKTPGELRAALAAESDLWVDRSTRLLYACRGMAVNAEPAFASIPASGAPFPASQTFLLHSRPGSGRKVYLDFNGHTTSGTSWNSQVTGGADIVSAPFDLDGSPSTFGASEMDVVQRTWLRVAEDYAPFDVDVTTEDPGLEGLRKSTTSDTAYGVRVVISPTTAWYPGAGGVAYVGSFNWSSDTPCFAFSSNLANSERYIAEATSHEVGHTLGLRHDGLTNGTAYYEGQGNWAPIMGVGYYKTITQFSKGEYAGANNLEDDIAIMANYGAPAIADDHGDSAATATPITGTNATVSGIIQSRTDSDWFSFTTAAGSVGLTVNPADLGPDLDIRMDVYNSSGALVASADPAGLPSSLALNLAAGTYFVRIDGVGAGDPATTGYSDYASLGQYMLSVNTPGAGNQAPVAVMTATPTSGTAPLAVNFDGTSSYDPDAPAGSIVSYAWTFGDGGTGSGATAAHTYTNAGTYTARLTVTDNAGATGTTTTTITVSSGAPNPATILHIESVSLSIVANGKNRSVRATVVVKDGNGAVVSGVTVTGSFTGPVAGAATGTTDTNGVALLTSKVTKSTGQVSFTVTGVAKSGYSYDPSKNGSSGGSITL